jgi:hypothetical protein
VGFQNSVTNFRQGGADSTHPKFRNLLGALDKSLSGGITENMNVKFCKTLRLAAFATVLAVVIASCFFTAAELPASMPLSKNTLCRAIRRQCHKF